MNAGLIKGSLLTFVIAIILHYWGRLGGVLKLSAYIGAITVGVLLGCVTIIFPGKQHKPRIVDHQGNATLHKMLWEIMKENNENSEGDAAKHPIVISRNVDSVLDEILNFTIRDFVSWWYKGLVTYDEHFLQLVKNEVWMVVRNLKYHLEKIDDVKFLTSDIVWKIHHHFQKIRFASAGPSEKVPFVLSSFLSTKVLETEHLRKISEFLLVIVLPPKYPRCQPVRHLLREIVSCLIFQPLVDLLTDPHYINENLVAYLQWQQAEMERHKRTYTFAETYEDFISMINQCNSVEDLKGLRYFIVTEIVQATTIKNLKKERNKELDKESRLKTKGDQLQARNLRQYINQLGFAKSQCEKMIKSLGGPDYTSPYYEGTLSQDQRNSLPGRKVLSFAVIMEHAFCRKYLATYLEKEGKSMLGFWEAVEELKRAEKTSWHQLGNEIFQTYINHPTSAVKFPKHILKGMEAFMMADKGPDAFCQAQTEIYKLLENRYYPSFIVCDVYHQMITEALKKGIDFTQSNDDNLANQSDYDQSGRSNAEGTPPQKDISLSDHYSYARGQLHHLIDRITVKNQALQALRTTPKSDPKMANQLDKEIEEMEIEKCELECHLERTEAWSEYLGQWMATLDAPEITKENDKSVLNFTVMVHLKKSPNMGNVSSSCITGWVVLRSTADFHYLQQKLLPAAPWLKKLDLPSQTKPRFKSYDKAYVEKAKNQLQTFLSAIMLDDQLNKSEALYCFFIPTPAHLKSSLPSHKKSSKFSIMHLFRVGPTTGPNDSSDDDELLYLALDDAERGDDIKDSIAEPLYTLIGEIFELHGMFSWLRKSLIVFVQVAYGNTINRQLRDTIAWITSESMLQYYLEKFQDSMWPGGQLARPKPVPSEREKQQTREKAKRLLLSSIPVVLSDLVGQQNARKGMAKVFEALQDARLNKQLLYDIIEAFLYEFAPELRPK